MKIIGPEPPGIPQVGPDLDKTFPSHWKGNLLPQENESGDGPPRSLFRIISLALIASASKQSTFSNHTAQLDVLHVQSVCSLVSCQEYIC